MNLTTEQHKAIEDMAYQLITPNLVAINLEVDEWDFVHEVRTPGTPCHQSYYKGMVRQMLDTRQAIIRAAHNGSNPAQAELLKFLQQGTNHLKYE